MRLTATMTARLIAIMASVFLSWSASYAGTTDIAPAPLANAGTAIVKPNLAFILDDSGSMDRIYMPDYVDDGGWWGSGYCKDDDLSLQGCEEGDPAWNNSKFNTVYYNPEVTYLPPVRYDGTEMESYDTNTEWGAVPNDGFGIQFSGTTNIKGGIPDHVWCDDNNPSSSERDYDNVPNSVCKLPIEAGEWKYPDATYEYREDMYDEKYPYYYVSTQTFPLPNQLLWCDTQVGSEPERGLGTGVYPPASGQPSCGLKKDQVNPHASSMTFRYPKFGTWQRIEIKPGDTYHKYGSRSDCAGAIGAGGCSYSEEMTNFANWWAYYRSRMQTMKSAAGRAFVKIDDKFRVGFITINPGSPVSSNQYLGVADFDATHKQNWFTKFYAQDAGGSTPLREALSRVGRYYANVTTGINSGMSDDPIQYSCQQNFSILTSDGYWTSNAGDKLDGTAIGDHDSDTSTAPLPMFDGNSDSGTLADVAQYYYINDLRANGSTGALGIDVGPNNVPGQSNTDVQNDTASHQHMTTFSLGMGVDGTLLYAPDYRDNPTGDFLAIKDGSMDWPTPSSNDPTGIDDLWHAAVNGRGKYFSAKDPTTLSAGLTEALVGVNATIGSAAAAATSNLEPITGDNYVFIANYETVFWNGDVEAREIDLGDGSVSATALWSAQTELDDLTAQTTTGGLDRKIYYHKPGATDNIAEFLKGNLSATEQSWFEPAWISGLSQWASLDPIPLVIASDPTYLIHFLRGDDTYEAQASNGANYHVWRDRDHVLGDIVNAQPVYVRTANADYNDTGYDAFKACVNDGVGTGCAPARVPNVYVAANDGMLHALNADTGEERWAFIPRSVMPNLSTLR